MAGIEFTNSHYMMYPTETMFSVPVDEVDLPRPVESSLPSGTTHIAHTVYLGVRPGSFLEQRRAATGIEGNVVTQEQYHEVLQERDIPVPPENVLWQPVKTLWVKKYQMIAAVEEPQMIVEEPQDDPSQVRVTMISGGLSTDKPSYEFVRSGTKYTNKLAALGFPEDAFDYLREDTRYLSKRTDKHARRFRHPLIRPLVWCIDRFIANPIIAADIRRIPEGQLITTVRTHRDINK